MATVAKCKIYNAGRGEQTVNSFLQKRKLDTNEEKEGRKNERSRTRDGIEGRIDPRGLLRRTR